MIKIVMGMKGSGKTKFLIDHVNQSVQTEHGNVVCIEYASELRFDVSHDARLISAEEYKITNFEQFYGFVCGLLAGNYDITSIYVDSVFKICGKDMDAFELFLKRIVPALGDVKLVITASCEENEATEYVKQYIGSAENV